MNTGAIGIVLRCYLVEKFFRFPASPLAPDVRVLNLNGLLESRYLALADFRCWLDLYSSHPEFTGLTEFPQALPC